jgi:phage shock protein PspC (stress-responsive transcriptional regulator)
MNIDLSKKSTEETKINELEKELALKQQKLKIKELENQISNSNKQLAGEMPATKKGGYDSIYCSSDDKYVLGLCGGLSHKFGLPVALVRLIFIIASGFFIGWIYLAGFFLPKLPTKNY